MDTAKRQQPDLILVDWHSLPEEMLLPIFSHWEVKTLLEKKRVCRSWRQPCTEAINAKKTMAFTTSQELCQAARRYCGYHEDLHQGLPRRHDRHSYHHYHSPDEAEVFAQTYGWPMNQWVVSELHDVSLVSTLRCWDVLLTSTCGAGGQSLRLWRELRGRRRFISKQDARDLVQAFEEQSLEMQGRLGGTNLLEVPTLYVEIRGGSRRTGWMRIATEEDIILNVQGRG